jgi:hypothetical protein
MSFTHFMAIDWSARNKPSPAKPSKDAIWLAEATATGRVRTHYFRTRHACHTYLEGRLLRLRDKRVLVGWDFCFGYPKGLAKALRLKGKPPWRAVWDFMGNHIADDVKNQNNRFAVGGLLNERIRAPGGPFWGVPTGQSGIFLGSKRDFDYPVPTKRGWLEERRLVERLHPRMQPAWKLAYTGSVGSQSLLGIPYVAKLRDHEKLRDVSRVWPFEASAGVSVGRGGGPSRKPGVSQGAPIAIGAGASIIHAEIYPSLLTLPKRDRITDREQVRSYVKWLQQQQREGKLIDLLRQPWGEEEKVDRRVRGHEGWVLGLLREPG